MKRRRLMRYGGGVADTAARASCASTAPSTESTNTALSVVQWPNGVSWPQSLDMLYGTPPSSRSTTSGATSAVKF